MENNTLDKHLDKPTSNRTQSYREENPNNASGQKENLAMLDEKFDEDI